MGDFSPTEEDSIRERTLRYYAGGASSQGG
jgi:hypothetical protein